MECILLCIIIVRSVIFPYFLKNNIEKSRSDVCTRIIQLVTLKHETGSKSCNFTIQSIMKDICAYTWTCAFVDIRYRGSWWMGMFVGMLHIKIRIIENEIYVQSKKLRILDFWIYSLLLHLYNFYTAFLQNCMYRRIKYKRMQDSYYYRLITFSSELLYLKQIYKKISSELL